MASLALAWWPAPASAQTASVTLAWEANTEPDLTGYIVQVGTRTGGPYQDRVTTTATTETVDALNPGTTYYFVVRALNALGRESALSNEVSATMPDQPPPDDCAPVTGRYAVSIFLTSLLKTGSGGPGSRARLLWQLGSPNAPITSAGVYADGALVSRITKGEDLTDDPGSWFTMPASGSYTLAVTAANSQGCTKTVTYPVPLSVP